MTEEQQDVMERLLGSTNQNWHLMCLGMIVQMKCNIFLVIFCGEAALVSQYRFSYHLDCLAECYMSKVLP